MAKTKRNQKSKNQILSQEMTLRIIVLFIFCTVSSNLFLNFSILFIGHWRPDTITIVVASEMPEKTSYTPLNSLAIELVSRDLFDVDIPK